MMGKENDCEDTINLFAVFERDSTQPKLRCILSCCIACTKIDDRQLNKVEYYTNKGLLVKGGLPAQLSREAWIRYCRFEPEHLLPLPPLCHSSTWHTR
jgi:hypothetical protein